MQMAKVSVAVEALHLAGLPFISVLNDPTYGGVSASYAMQADVKIALSNARIGFAGPAVILNTMCEADQNKFDTECPADFQSATYLQENGQVDTVLDVKGKNNVEIQTEVEKTVATIAMMLTRPKDSELPNIEAIPVTQQDKEAPFNYTNSRILPINNTS